MPDDAIQDDTARMDCGCTDTHPVCAHHRSMFEYAKAFDLASGQTGSELPGLVLRPTLRTWLRELDTFRMVLLAGLVLGVPLLTVVMGATVTFALGEVALFLVPIALFLLTFANLRLTLDPRTRTVHFRNWRRRTIHLVVDDEMQARGFQYVDLGVTSPAANVVLWTPNGTVRLDQRTWGIDQLDDLVFVLGVPVGGVYSDQDLEEMFPGTLPLISRRPKAFAAALVVGAFAVVIAVGFAIEALNSDDAGAQSTDADASQSKLSDPKPSSMPADVEVRQDALDASLKNVLAGNVAWATSSTIHRCNEQPGWQRETSYRLQEGGRAPSDRLVATFTEAVEKAGLSIQESTVDDDRVVLRTQYTSASGAGVWVYVEETPSGSSTLVSTSLHSASECAVTSK